jgi:hypothetical protein
VPVEFFFIVLLQLCPCPLDQLLQFLGLGTAERSPSQSTGGLVASSSVPDRISSPPALLLDTLVFRFFGPNEQTTLPKARGESCVCCVFFDVAATVSCSCHGPVFRLPDSWSAV